MKRWTMHLLAGCCAVMALVVMVHWAYSWFYMDRMIVRVGQMRLVVGTGRGQCWLLLSRYVPEKIHDTIWEFEYGMHHDLRNGEVPTVWTPDHSFLGIGFGSKQERRTQENYLQFHETRIDELANESARRLARGLQPHPLSLKLAKQLRQDVVDFPRFVQVIEFPSWLLALVLAPLPAWWFPRAVRTRWRQRRGRCRRCGYDLRATPQRCPECGAVTAASQEAGRKMLPSTPPASDPG